MRVFVRYNSLPRTVEAVQFLDSNKDRVFNSLTGQFAHEWEGDEPILKVTTAHGEIAIVRLGDWIVRDVNLGTYYPVKHEVFIKAYGAIEDD